MTIGIGMLCHGGAIVTTDTKVTLGDWSVTEGNKLVGVKASWGNCAIANSANDGNAAKTVVRKMASSLENKSVKGWDDLEQIVVREMTTWHRAWKRPPEVQFILAAEITGTGVGLYLCEPPNTFVPQPEGYIAIGTRSAVTDPLFKTLFSGFSVNYDPQRTLRMLAYLIRRAKEGNAFCGGWTHALYIKSGALDPVVINSLSFEKAEVQSGKLDFLLGAAAKLTLFSEPGENLKRNAKGIGQLIQGLEGLRATVFCDVSGHTIS